VAIGSVRTGQRFGDNGESLLRTRWSLLPSGSHLRPGLPRQPQDTVAMRHGKRSHSSFVINLQRH